ncbi:serine protease [Earliella scabrosa]|nr:serine protease [Earliella scabrosa]
MKFLVLIAAALASVTPSIAAPSKDLVVPILQYVGDVIPNSYIVKLKDGASKDAHLSWLASTLGSVVNITHNDWSPSVLNGYSGILQPLALTALRARGDVEYIEEDGIMQATAIVTQTNATWGLDRIDGPAPIPAGSNPTALTYNYIHDNTGGTGVDVYVIDTGCNNGHVDFGGRAVQGPVTACELRILGICFIPSPPGDQNGHGSHVAGTVGSNTYGVAKRVTIVCVKVLNAAGSGSTSDIVAGLNYVVTTANASGRPSVASMSLGGGISPSLDTATANTVAAGVHTVVAAGNDNVDAANTSPARVPQAVTVGASNINDARSSFSNFGPVVDLFAPGEQVVSTSNIGNGMQTLSGTSMAAPHVAGMIAYLISTEGNLTPAAMVTKLTTRAIPVLSNIPAGTANRLAQLNP